MQIKKISQSIFGGSQGGLNFFEIADNFSPRESKIQKNVQFLFETEICQSLKK